MTNDASVATVRGRQGVRRGNAASVVQVLIERGPVPRIDLAEAVGLSTGAVTRITQELTSVGLLRELDPLASADAGRRRVPVDLEAERFLAVGVNVGFDDIIYGLVDLRGRLVGPAQRSRQRSTDPAATADQMVTLVDQLIADRPAGASIIGCGVSVGGTVERPSGAITDADVLGWFDVDIVGLLHGRLPGVVAVDSTYRALARAESWFAAARSAQHFVHLFVRHSIGAAFVFNGADYYGANSLAGGVAHWPVSVEGGRPCTCGRRGCLTAVASVAAVLHRAQDAGLSAASVQDVLDLAGHDARAAAIIEDRARAVGEVAGLLVESLAPDMVVVSASAMAEADFDTMRSTARMHLGHPRDLDSVIVPTGLGDPYDANVVGTATLVLQAFYDDPLALIPDARL